MKISAGMVEPKPPFKVIIIGSGLAGSLLANGLIRNDVEVSVYERMQRHAKREGYQIRLGAPALKGMRACLGQAQIDFVVSKFGRAGGRKAGAPVCYDDKFNTVLDLSKFPTYSKSAPVNRGVLRDTLADPVFESGKLHYGYSFDRYEITNPRSDEERVRVWFEDGSCDDCDVLIGADGSHSQINLQIGLDNIKEIKSHISMIAKNELPTERFLTMASQLREKPILTMADGKVIYFCAYLPDKIDADGSSSTAEIDDSLSSSMFAAHIPTEMCPPDLFEHSIKDKWEFVSFAFRNWAAEYHEIIDLVTGSDLYVYKARASVRPPKSWRQKAQSASQIERGHPRVWLLGDAMHAMLPARGMGGNQAMCDTATILPLMVRLADLARSGEGGTMAEEITKACKEYEDEMIPRTFSWVEKSGGLKMLPFDSSTLTGKLFFTVAAAAMNLAFIWYQFVGLFMRRKFVDDAPELHE